MSFVKSLNFLELTNCEYFVSPEWNYNVFIDLRTLKNVRPPGYIVRIPLYVIGSDDANIALSTVAELQYRIPVAYEIGIIRIKIANVKFPLKKILNFQLLTRTTASTQCRTFGKESLVMNLRGRGLLAHLSSVQHNQRKC